MPITPIEPRALAVIQTVGHVTASPAGDQVAYVSEVDGRCQLLVVPAAGGISRRVTAELAPPSAATWAAGDIDWSRDGRRLAFTAKSGAGTNIWTVDLESGVTARLTHYNWADRAPRWSPDGTHVAFVTEVDGRDIVSVAGTDGDWPRRVSDPVRHSAEPAWSPDGTALAFTVYTSAEIGSPNRDIVVADLASGARRQLTSSDGNADESPAWSPDGSTIAFVSERSGWKNVYLMRADGTEQRALLPEAAEQVLPVWSPDGHTLAFKRQSGVISEARVVRVEDGALIPLDPALAGNAVDDLSWLHDGSGLAMVRMAPTRPREVVVARLDGTPALALTAVTPATTVTLPLTDPTTVRYRSADDREIEALLFTPADAAAGEARPGLVYVHGGPTWQVERGWFPDVQHLVSNGYTVIAPNFRGSTGYGREFDRANDMDWGGGDLEDCVAAANELRKLPWIAADRVGIWGGSYGGYMTLIGISKRPDAFQAGVDLYGSSDEATLWMQTDAPGRRGIEQEVGLPLLGRTHYRQGAGIHFAQQITAPLIIFHGTEDARVTLQQSEAMVKELERLGKRFEYHTYPGEAHGFRKIDNWCDVQDKVVEFLGRVL